LKERFTLVIARILEEMSGGPDYGNASYWDERYSGDEQSYDWYMDYRALQPYLQPYLVTEGDFEILIAGCGNSSKIGRFFFQIFYQCKNFLLTIFFRNWCRTLRCWLFEYYEY
jgi:hypothetical protein